MSGISEEAEMLVLQNDNFMQNHKLKFGSLLHSTELSDVTLVCKGHFVKAHRLMLTISSQFFNDMFNMCGYKDTIVVLNDVSARHMASILQYIYTGECQVHQTELTIFLKVADSLLIHGLSAKNKDGREAGNSVAKSPGTEYVTEEIPGNVATSPGELLTEEITIKEEEQDCGYFQFEDVATHGSSAASPSLQSQAMAAQEPGVMYNTTDTVSRVTIAVPPVEEAEPVLLNDDRSFNDEVLYAEMQQTLTSGHNKSTAQQQLSRKCPGKRKKKTEDTQKDDSFCVSNNSFVDTSQPGPSKRLTSNPPLSSSAEAPPSFSADKTARGKRRKTIISCAECQKVFRDKCDLNRHYASVHADATTSATCSLCNKIYKSEHNLKCHMMYRHSEHRVMTCEYEQCNFTFTAYADLKQHVYSVHESGVKNRCSICRKLFRNRQTVAEHLVNIHNIPKKDANPYILEK